MPVSANPAGVDFDVVVNVMFCITAELPSVKLAGAVHVTPAGAVPLAAHVTVIGPVKLFTGVNVSGTVPPLPALTVSVAVFPPPAPVTVKSGTRPTPLRVAVRITVVPATVVFTVTAPARAPPAVGLKITEIVQFPIAARLVPQVFVCV